MIHRARMRGLALHETALVPQIPANARHDGRAPEGLGVEPRALLDVKFDESPDFGEIRERNARRNAGDVNAFFHEHVFQPSPRVAMREFELQGLEPARQG